MDNRQQARKEYHKHYRTHTVWCPVCQREIQRRSVRLHLASITHQRLLAAYGNPAIDWDKPVAATPDPREVDAH